MEKVDKTLSEAICNADECVRSLGHQLFAFEETRERTLELLKQAADATAEDVLALTSAIVPALGHAVARAWQRLSKFSIFLSDSVIGDPALPENRSIWLRDLLRELARFELPSKQDDALRWLAVYGGAHAEKIDSEIIALMSMLLGTTFFRVGTSGGDHVGRLLACEISQGTNTSEDIFDTLRLVGTGRHAALSAEKQFVPSPHVARGLAACGHAEAIAALCDTIAVNRHNPELTLLAALQAVAAAVELVNVTPDVLSAVLESIAEEIADHKLTRETLAQPLSTLLALPSPFLTGEQCVETLLTCVRVLSDIDSRERMLDSDDETDMVFGLWALAACDVMSCGERLLERYEQACDDQREDTKLILRTFARLRETRNLAMRPLWIRMLSETVSNRSQPLNLALVAEVLAFQAAAGLKLAKGISMPADAALGMLIELEERLREPAIKEELVKVSAAGSAHKIDATLASFIVANLAGRSVDVLLPLVASLDFASFALLAEANFSQSDAQTRAAVFERAKPSYLNGSRIMARAVAAADTVEELMNWSLPRFERHSVDPLFVLCCALRRDRHDFWRAFLLASKKATRELGLKVLIATFKVLDKAQRFEESKVLSIFPAEVLIDDAGIRADATRALDEYEAAQSVKKKGDDLRSHYLRTARELARTEDMAEQEAATQRNALISLCEHVAHKTGIALHRFAPTKPQPPRDCGSTYADLLGQAAPKLLPAMDQFLTELQAQSLDYEEQSRRFNQWFAGRGTELREADGSEVHRLFTWLGSVESWVTFDEKVLRRATPLMSQLQLTRIGELSPPWIPPDTIRLLRNWVRTLLVDVRYDDVDDLFRKLDWYESILANLPAEIQQLGPKDQNSAVPHPPHQSVVAYVYQTACDYLRSSNVEAMRKAAIRKRLWPLLWWTASYGPKVDSIDASAIGVALSNDLATLFELVWFLIQPGEIAVNLIQAVEAPERFCLGMNAERDLEIRATIEAVAELCREQEFATNPSLPSKLANTWQKLPAPPSESLLVDVLRKYSQVTYQAVGSLNEEQKMFVKRLDEALSLERQSWTGEGKGLEMERPINFDKVDVWRKNTTAQLTELLASRTVSIDLLLRVAMHHPMLLRSTLEATGQSQLLEATIWIVAHLGFGTSELAMTLDANTGHASLRRAAANASQLGFRLVAHYVPGVKEPLNLFASAIDEAPICKRWKESAIDAQPRHELEPLFTALKAVRSASDRQRIEGLLNAMDGKLSSPAQRAKLEASIKERPNASLLQLALLPLPGERAEMLADISRRLQIFEVISIAGRKCKSGEARENVHRAVDRVRRTLAKNAGLADPVQLDWLSGEAIAKELEEFARAEQDDYVMALQLRVDGPRLLLTKSGKALKSMPAALKSSDMGKRLTELRSRLENSLRETRAALESSMIEDRNYAADDLKMMMQHPVVAAVARELLFVMVPPDKSHKPTVGLPSVDGVQLMGLDGTGAKVTGPVRIAHPLELDKLGVLGKWQSWLTDHPPQPFQQVERIFVHLKDLLIDDGIRVVGLDGATAKNLEQSYRILQSHGWQIDRELNEMYRAFPSELRGTIIATLPEFLLQDYSFGPLLFRDKHWHTMPIAEVPPIILSEAVRDIRRD